MGTRMIQLEGKLFWGHVFEENRDLTGFQGAALDTDGQLTIEMVLDEDNYNKLRDSGSMKYRPRDHDQGDGTYKVKFVRKWDTGPGREWQCGPIPVKKPDGSDWMFSVDGVIPNGSTGKVTLSVYDIKGRTTTGTRLEGVHVSEVAELPELEDEN